MIVLEGKKPSSDNRRNKVLLVPNLFSASGGKTTIYNVEENGDPNDLLPDDTEKEMQFYIKWKHWAHIHNTWESELNLREQKVNGLKKLDNYMKRMEEIKDW